MLDAPIRPHRVSAEPLLRSALAAGEREPDGQADDELMHGLFGADIDVELGDETRGMPSGPMPSLTAEADISHDQLEGRDPIILRSPVRPSAEAIDRHNSTHVPYRSWCEVCVRAKGKEDPHPRKRAGKVEEHANKLPRLSLDYQELKSKAKKPSIEEGKTDKVLKIVVMKDEESGSVFSHRVDMKGPGDVWVVKKLVADIEELGRRDIILKTDGEPAMLALQRAMALMRPGLTKPENPPAYNPSSNGACEKAVQDVSAQIRTLTLALEARLGLKIEEDHPVMDWIIAHAAYLVTKFSVGHDGMTPHERLTGRKWTRPMIELGEVVLAKLALRKIGYGKRKAQKNKLADRSIKAILVGQIGRTGEHIIIKQNGDAARCRTVRRVPLEDRWRAEDVLNIRGTPRKPAPSRGDSAELSTSLVDDEAGDIRRTRTDRRREVREGQEAAAQDDDCGANLGQPQGREPHEDIRRFRITEPMLDKYGHTDGCDECDRKLNNWPGRRHHTEGCRMRLQQLIADDETDRSILERQAARIQGRNEPDKQQSEATEQGKEPDGVAPQDTPDMPPLCPQNPRGVREDAVPNDEARQRLASIPEEQTDDQGTNDDHTGIPDQTGIPELCDESDEDMPQYEPSSPAEEQEDTPPPAKRSRVALFREWKSKQDDINAKTGEKLGDCIKMLNDLKKCNDVKAIIKTLEEKHDFGLPKNRRQRRSMNCQGKHHVSEIYSPPRITKMARKMGLAAGWALDLTEVDPDDNEPWDFSKKEKRDKAMCKLKQDEPLMLIVSPMCGPFSQLQSLFNYPKQEHEHVERQLKDAMEHVKFSLEMCLEQYTKGRLFMFEHPAGAASWSMQAIQQMKSLEGVSATKFDFCMLGMKTTDSEGKPTAARKKTIVMTNSQAITLLLREAQCRAEHAHTPLLGGKAGPCQEYPDVFCRLICEGVKRERDTLKWKGHMQEVFDISRPLKQLLSVQQKIEKLMCPPEEHGMYQDATFYDDITGSELNKAEAVKARLKEIKFFRDRGVYTKVWRESHMKIINTKWLDVNKGDAENLNIRARLVGCEFATEKRDDLFAATPPLESLRMILSICASNQSSKSKDDNFIIMSNDVSRAYFYAPTTRPIYIAIPKEDWEPGDEGKVAKLNLSLYGTRDAARNWAEKFTSVMVKMGFVRGMASPCNFHHPGRNISTTVHGDDFTSTGREGELKWFEAELLKNFEIKTEYLGPDTKRHLQEIRVLNRVINWTADGVTYEADPRHAEILIRELQLEGSKPVTTPGAREDVGKASVVMVDDAGRAVNLANESSGPDLSKADATKYRGLAARANYLAQDRLDVQFAVKEIARRMSSPKEGDMGLLRRLARYLIGAPRAIYAYAWQSNTTGLDAYVDSDWAGCKGSRRSTSGGALSRGQHLLKSWSTTQATIALSSAEAELYSLVKGAAQTLGMMALARDLGVSLQATVNTDASAALGIIQRQGLGKLRHVSTQFLWVQEKVRRNEFDIAKVPGQDNPADILTKNVAAELIHKHTETLGVWIGNGRAQTAPQLSSITGDPEGGDRDAWEEGEKVAVRIHRQPRRGLFTPLRVHGAPPGKALTPERITRGKYLDSGEEFEITDTWTSRGHAHRQLKADWTGETEFHCRSKFAR